MCGIYGMVSLSGVPLRTPDHAATMRRSLAHRGPDGHGCVSLPHAVIGVNRLRIIDRRSEADQPFTDPSGRVSIAVNGEIYNSSELRSQFPDYSYRSRSDVEPVLPLYLARGAEGLAELEGMFAVAVWDERTRTLVLARDRAGEKPLFVRHHNSEIWFASEIQALMNGARPSPDFHALAEITRLGYPLEPRTVWSGISGVGAGTILTIDSTGRHTHRYWPPDPRHPAPDTSDDLGMVERLLDASVRKQLRADVPLGVFTSGGLDSALIVAIASKYRPGQLSTFTARFPERSYDEGDSARRLARHFGTCHVEAIADPPALRDALHTVITSIAEPIADPAILPTLILAKRARESVGVVLSGEGADELFGGYPTYLGHRLADRFARLPKAVRGTVRALATAWPSSYGKVTTGFLINRFVAAAELPWFERHVAWFGTGLGPGILEPGRDVPMVPPARRSDDYLDDLMRWDYESYLRCLLLPKIDRATSLVALEARAPFLDRDLVAFELQGRAEFKVRGFRTKARLRELARPWLPSWVLRRRKRGLSVPVARWLNGALTPEVDRVFEPGRLRRQGLLNPGKVGELVAQHRRGRVTAARGLWTLFVLQLWMDHWMPEASG